MKITDVRTVLLTGPCTGDPFLSELRKRRSAAFIEISTDDGLVGIGETYAGYFCPEIVPEIVAFFRPILVGQGIDEIGELWRRLYHCGNFWCRVGLGTSVLSGIESALWDLRGKAEGKPVWQLLGEGSVHESLLCYATGGPSNFPTDKLAEKLEFYRSLGFTAAKLGVGSFSLEDGSSLATDPAEAADFEAAKLDFVRQRFGAEFILMLDGHMGNSATHTWDTATAIEVVKACEPFDLFFFEEPLHYTNPWGYAELCEATTVPIAGGECLTAETEWRTFIERDCFDIGQPDAGFLGGLGEFLRVAKRFEDRGRKIATHAWGAGGVFMQNLHAGFACANTTILEVPPAWGPLHSEIIGESFVMRDGRALAPTAPGLGITLSEETRARYPFQPGSGEYNSVPGKIMPELAEREST